MSKTLKFDSQLNWYETVAEFPGKIGEYILYQKNDNTIQLKRAAPTNTTEEEDKA